MYEKDDTKRIKKGLSLLELFDHLVVLFRHISAMCRPPSDAELSRAGLGSRECRGAKGLEKLGGWATFGVLSLSIMLSMAAVQV